MLNQLLQIYNYNMHRKRERDYARLWWDKIYPEGVANYNRMLREGLENNKKWWEEMTRGIDDITPNEWDGANRDFLRSKDKNVNSVCDKLVSRSEVGLKKYGVTTEREDIELEGWLNHLQEELLDAAVYVQTIKDGLQKSEDI